MNVYIDKNFTIFADSDFIKSLFYWIYYIYETN